MKKFSLVFTVILFINMQVGCKPLFPDQNEINKITFIKVASVDKLSDDKVSISVISSKQAPSSGQQGGGGGGQSSSGESYEVFSSEGDTIFQAARNMYTFADKIFFWGHLDFIIIGEEAAKDDIYKYLDVFIRDNDIRLGINILIAKGTKGADILNEYAAKTSSLADVLDNHLESAGRVSVSSDIRFIEIINALSNPYKNVYIPSVYIQDGNEDSKQQQKPGDEKRLELNGYGIFHKGKLEKYLSDEEAKAFNWVVDRIKVTGLVVQDKNGRDVSLDVISSKTQITSKFKNDRPSIQVKITIGSNYQEHEGTGDMLVNSNIEYLNEQQSKLVQLNVEKIIRALQKDKIDAFGFGDKIYHQHPVKWQEIKNDWEKIFPQVEFSVEVNSKVNRSYKIRSNIKNKGELQK